MYIKKLFIFCLPLLLFLACNSSKESKTEEPVLVISDSLKWSERMALSIMKCNPEVWNVDQHPEPRWDYKIGLLLTAYEQLYQATGNEQYYNYIKQYTDSMIDSLGNIYGYEKDNYNIDLINPGKLLFNLYNTTKDEKYLIALKQLRAQLEDQPRTESGGFWHKKIYPNQMWLDGLYMGEPFYARYTTTFENGENLSDVALQFKLLHDHSFDEKTGLYLHAWDESKAMPWANQETGTAPNVWLRALGWYAMALVDALDYFPEDHPDRELLITYLNELTIAVANFQDETGLWYQVPNMGDKADNYLEASGSAMLSYALAKGVHKGYLPESAMVIAQNAFDGLTNELIEIDPDGEIHLTQICGSAGLGGDPYRDGSYDYYMREKIKVDNSHGLAPFILAAVELNQ